MQYTKSQTEAIAEVAHNLQIIAGAGSSKTQVISARVIEILRTQRRIRPANMVAFTFTDNAAAELKDRITRLARVAAGKCAAIESSADTRGAAQEAQT